LLKKPVERVHSYRNQSEALNKKIKSVEELLGNRDMNLEVLRELTGIFPPDTFLQSYRCQDGSIQLAGFSASASDLIPKLEKSPLLKDVVTKGITYRDAAVGKERFTLEARWEK